MAQLVVETTRLAFSGPRLHKGEGWEDFLSEAWIEAHRRTRLHDPRRQTLEKYIQATCCKSIVRERHPDICADAVYNRMRLGLKFLRDALESAHDAR